MYMHERQAVAKAVSWEIGPWWWTVIRDRVFRVHRAACRAGRPRSGSLAQRNPPPTNRYCPHRHHQQQHPGWTEGRKEGPEEEERTERRDETGLFHLEKGCVWRQRRRGGDKWTGGRLRGGKDGEEEAPVLSAAVCVCLYVCSHTVEINLPSGLSLWNKERRKLARSDTTQREMEKDKTGTRRQSRVLERWRWGHETCVAPPTAPAPNTTAVIRKIGLQIPPSTCFWIQINLPVWYFWPILSGFSKYLPQKLRLMRKSSHLLSWRDVVLD